MKSTIAESTSRRRVGAVIEGGCHASWKVLLPIELLRPGAVFFLVADKSEQEMVWRLALAEGERLGSNILQSVAEEPPVTLANSLSAASTDGELAPHRFEARQCYDFHLTGGAGPTQPRAA